LEQGEFFGEVALLKKDKRTANVVAMHPGAECLTLDRELIDYYFILLNFEYYYYNYTLWAFGSLR
jgi:CRP-like cAMP-binding protein